MYWIFRKLSNMFLTLFGVTTIIFFLFNVLPGDPAQMMVDQQEDSLQMEQIKKKYGFNLPISSQYLLYINDLSPFSYHSVNHEDLSFFSQDKYFSLMHSLLHFFITLQNYVSPEKKINLLRQNLNIIYSFQSVLQIFQATVISARIEVVAFTIVHVVFLLFVSK